MGLDFMVSVRVRLEINTLFYISKMKSSMNLNRNLTFIVNLN